MLILSSTTSNGTILIQMLNDKTKKEYKKAEVTRPKSLLLLLLRINYDCVYLDYVV
jgi:hypothetical protein